MNSNRRRLLAGATGLVAVAALAGFAGWWFLIRSDAPPEVDLAAAVSTLGTTPATTAAPATSATSADTSPATTGGTTAPATTGATTAPPAPVAAGSWAVDAASGSFVGYRVEEELAGIGAATAVGRTPLVSGTMTIDGSTVTAVDVTADLTGLESDDSRRDRALRTRGLETQQFPEATFTLAEPIELDQEPADGQTFGGVATGDLTLHGVTQRVAVPVEGQFTGGAIVVVGSLPVDFADHGIEAPTSFIALSVDDNGVLELQLVFRPS